MVRCNIPCCFDDMCMHPYPGEEYYDEAVSAREDYMASIRNQMRESRKPQTENLAALTENPNHPSLFKPLKG